MKKVNLLLTCVGGGLSYQLIELIKESNEYNYTITGVDTSEAKVAKSILDFYEKVPHGSDPDYASRIFDICKKYDVEIVFPGSDEEAISLSKNKKIFDSEGITVACNDIEIMNIISNKISTYEALENIGIEVPNYRVAKDQSDLKNYIDKYIDENKSCVVKLPEARGGRGTIIIEKDLIETIQINNSRQLKTNPNIFFNKYLKNYSFDEPLMVMEKLYEPIYDLDILAWKSKPINIVSRKRINANNPNEGHILEENRQIIDVGKKIIDKFNIKWIFDIDFMLSNNGSPAILEINPRASGSLAISLKAGVPIFDNMISLINDELIIEKDVPYGCVIQPYTGLRKD